MSVIRKPMDGEPFEFWLDEVMRAIEADLNAKLEAGLEEIRAKLLPHDGGATAAADEVDAERG